MFWTQSSGIFLSVTELEFWICFCHMGETHKRKEEKKMGGKRIGAHNTTDNNDNNNNNNNLNNLNNNNNNNNNNNINNNKVNISIF